MVKLASPGSLQAFKDALTSDPRVSVKVVRETDYYAEQSQALVSIVNFLAGIITTLMGLGAIFGALNTMYTAVAARAREIATLEAIGFRGLPIVVSVLLESVLLSAIGGTIGALGAWLAFRRLPHRHPELADLQPGRLRLRRQRRPADPRHRLRDRHRPDRRHLPRHPRGKIAGGRGFA